MFSFRQFQQIISVHQPVEVRLEEAVLDDAVFLEFGFGEFFGVVCGDVAGGIQDGVSAGVQEDVHTVCPVLHRHRDVTVGHTLRQVQEGVDKVAHIIQLGFFEVILGNAYIGFDNLAGGGILPCRQTHVFFLCAGPLHD